MSKYFNNCFICFFLSFMVSHNVDAQLQVSWDKDFGGAIWEELNTSEETPDGGYILAGFSSSAANDGNVTLPNQGVGDYWMVKTDADGNFQWDARFGGNGLDRCNSIKVANDGGFILGGSSDSGLSGDKSEASRGLEDYWVVKTDPAGNLEWEKTIGGDGSDILSSVEPTSDGGYILGGQSFSGTSGEKSEASNGGSDFWIVKLDANGNLEWEKTIGGSEEERLTDIQEAPDGNFLAGGGSRSDVSGDVSTPLVGVKDYWFLKISAIDGAVIWERRYGGADEDEIQSFVQTSDGGYLLTGGSRSNISGDKSEVSRGIVDMWIVKTNAAGTKEWDRTFGGESLENCYSAKQNSVGYYILGGYSGSGVGIDKTEPLIGGWDYWVVYVDGDGNKVWDKTIGGAGNDVMFGIFQTTGGGYVMAGSSTSDVSGDKTDPTKGLNDFWLVKTICALSVGIPDQNVCDGQSTLVDAYSNIDCVQCEYNWSDIGIGDSIRTISPATDITLSVTLTDGVGCRTIDEFSLNIIPAPMVDLGADQSFCEGGSATLNAQNSGLSYQWSTDETTQEIVIDTTGIYAVTVSIGNGCVDIDTMNLEVFPSPEVNLGDDQEACVEIGFFLNAENIGSTYEWSTGESDQTITIFPPTIGATSVTVTDQNNCEGSDTINITGLVDSPTPMSVTTTCNLDNSMYTISFGLMGGDLATYQVNSPTISGTITGNQYLSDPIPKDQLVTFEVVDGNSCLPNNIGPTGGCPCTSAAGTMDITPLEICLSQGNFTVPLSSINLDDNDLIEYLLHDGDENNIGTVIYTQSDPVFAYQSSWNLGTTYYITARVGSNDGTGNVLTQDCCLSISEGVPVTFLEDVVSSITSDNGTQLSCNQSTLILSGVNSQPTGNLEYNWTATNGGMILSDPTLEEIEVNAAGTYTLLASLPNNTCTTSADIIITKTEDFPSAMIEDLSTLTCKDAILILNTTGTSNTPEFTYLWEGQNIGGFTGLSPQVTESGLYTITVTNTTNGCTATASANVLEDKMEPSIDAGDPLFLPCGGGTVSLAGLNVDGGTNYTYLWSTMGGNIVNGGTNLAPTVNDSGLYILEATNEDNGCKATDDVTVDLPEVPLAIIVPAAGSEISCNQSSLILSGTSSQPLGQVTFEWTAMNGGNIISANDLPEVEIDAPGTYILTVSLPMNPCMVSSVMEITASADIPQAVIEPFPMLSCDDPSIVLNTTGTSEGAIFSYQWAGTGIDDFMGIAPAITTAGFYQLTVTNTTNGCSQTASVEVLTNTILPMIDAGTTSFLSCDDETAVLTGAINSAGSNYSIVWNTVDGNILSDAETLSPVVDQSGTYILEVRNEDNGCSNTAEVIVSPDPNGPNDLLLSITDPNCFESTDGQIVIDSVIGGVGPYSFSLNESGFFMMTDFGQLSAGAYDLVVQDNAGCDWATTIELDQPLPLEIIPPIVEPIALGDSLQLDPIITSAVDTFYWTADPTLSCVDCLEPIVKPIDNTSYVLTAINDQGCTTESVIDIVVTKERLVYIPSAFSPNGDGFNDLFTFYGGQGIAKINYLRVFNRWGAAVFEQKDFSPGMETMGWDGTFKNKKLNVGLYIFVGQVEFLDGQTLEYSGGITLME